MVNTVDKGDSGLHPSYALATKQPQLKSGGLQSVVGNAGKSLQETDQE